MHNKQSSAISLQLSEGQKGQTLLEIVVVVAVLVLTISALVFATVSSLRNSQFSKNQSQATKLAQEGIEWVRVGRDRDQCILSMTNTSPAVGSWSGSNPNCSAGSIWGFQMSGDLHGQCNAPSANTQCYFNISSLGQLTYLGGLTSTPSGLQIPTNSVFTRMVLMSDDANWSNQKQVTVVVTWTDFSGSHESRLTTILRKL